MNSLCFSISFSFQPVNVMFCIDFFANTGAQGVVGYIAIKLPSVVHKNEAHGLPIHVVPHLATQLDQHAIRSHVYACTLGTCKEVYSQRHQRRDWSCCTHILYIFTLGIVFCSREPEGTFHVDALTLIWDGLLAYAFPPISLIHLVLDRVERHRCMVILVAPHWPRRSWLPRLLDLLVDIAIQLPVLPDLLQQRHSQRTRIQECPDSWHGN